MEKKLIHLSIEKRNYGHIIRKFYKVLREDKGILFCQDEYDDYRTWDKTLLGDPWKRESDGSWHVVFDSKEYEPKFMHELMDMAKSNISEQIEEMSVILKNIERFKLALMQDQIDSLITVVKKERGGNTQ